MFYAFISLLFVGTISAQEVDVDSLNSALLSHINVQRQAIGVEDLLPTQVLENASQDQANYCTAVKAETSEQKESKN